MNKSELLSVQQFFDAGDFCEHRASVRGVRARLVYPSNMKKETMLLSPPHSRRAKVTPSRVSNHSREVPVKYPVSRVRVLLDFKDDVASANRMEAAAGQKHGVAGLDLEGRNAFGDTPVLNSSFKFGAGHAAFQADKKLGPGAASAM